MADTTIPDLQPLPDVNFNYRPENPSYTISDTGVFGGEPNRFFFDFSTGNVTPAYSFMGLMPALLPSAERPDFLREFQAIQPATPRPDIGRPGAITPGAVRQAQLAINRMADEIQVDGAGNSYIGNKQIGGPEVTRDLSAKLLAADAEVGDAANIGTALPEKSAIRGLLDATKGWWTDLSDGTKTGLIGAVTALGLGGIGLALGQAAAGDAPRLNIPDAPGPTPERQATQTALQNVLRTPAGGTTPTTGTMPMPEGADPLQWAAMRYGPERNQGGATPGGWPYPPSAYAPNVYGNTGQQNLEGVFRSGLAGQNLISALAALQAQRELGTTAQQAPYEDALRQSAMASIPGFLTPSPDASLQMVRGPDGTYSLAPSIAALNADRTASRYGRTLNDVPDLPRLVDPIRIEIANELARAFSGQTASPLLDRTDREEEQALRNQLYRESGGAGYEASTPGSVALQRLRESQAIRREQNRQQTFANLLPQEYARRTSEYSTPLSAISTLNAADLARMQQGQQQRGTGLAERLALLGIGRTPTPQIATTLSGLTPISPLLGLESTDQQRNLNQQLQTNAALASYNNAAQSDRDLSNAISAIFGTAAGAMRPQYTFALPGAR